MGQNKKLYFFILLFICGFISPAYMQDENKSNQADSRITRIEGIVTDAATGNPVSGASILSGTYSVLTAEDGKFSIPIPLSSTSVTIMMPGYTGKEVAVRGRNFLEIEIYNDHFTGIYGNIPTETDTKNTLTLTQAVNTTDAFPNVAANTTLEDMIQTRLGNVRTITRSGTPLMGSSLFIRGLNSLNLKSQPLFIIDGVIWDNMLDATSLHGGFFINPLADIDMKDLESITVIKDAASIYGSKAANGVILVNTVRGHDIATKITLNAGVGYSLAPRGIPMMNAGDFKIYASEMYTDQGLFTTSQIDQMPLFNDDPNYIFYNKYHNNTDWQDKIFRNALNQSYSVNVTGGDDKALYAFSMGYSSIDNVIENSDLNRMNARFNSDIHLSSKLDLYTDISFTDISRNLFDDGLNERSAPYYVSLIKSPALYPYEYSANGNATPLPEKYDSEFGISNPVYILEQAVQTSKQYRFNVNARPEFKFTDKIKLSSLFAYSLDKVKEGYFIPRDGVTPLYIENAGYSYNTSKSNVARQTQLYNDTRFSYQLDWEKHNRIDFLAGMRFVSTNYEMDYIEGHNTNDNNIINISTNLDFLSTYGRNEENRYMSWYANGAYNLREKYMLNASFSMDANSAFGKNSGTEILGRGWAPFYSISGAWLISNEEFMSDINFLDYLKLRISYGITGNDNLPFYANKTYFESVNYIDKGIGLQLAAIGNEDLKWETSSKFNAGLDFSVFNDRLYITADLFTSKTKDLLMRLPLSNTSNVEYYWGNSGELSNKGFEVTAKLNVLDTRPFKWETNFNFSKYKNEITALPNTINTEIMGAEIQSKVGQPAGVFYGYKDLGVIASQADAEALHNGEGLKIINANGSASYFGAGDMLFEDKNNDGIINENDKTVIGDPNPDFTGLWGNSFKLKDFKLDVLFSFSYGNDVYNAQRRSLESMNNLNNQTTAVTNRWRVDGDVTSIPKLAYDDPMGNARFSSRWIEDGSYVRLKTISLSYKVPVKIQFIEGLTIWASANNLWHYSKYLGADPETSISNSVLYQGIDAGLTPQYTTYYLGVKINL